jgi:hypothetical protein
MKGGREEGRGRKGGREDFHWVWWHRLGIPALLTQKKEVRKASLGNIVNSRTVWAT